MIWIIILIVMGVFYVFKEIIKASHWKMHVLTMNEYLAKHPGAKTPTGISCFKCNSVNSKNYGLSGNQDTRRVTVCQSCNEWLFRSDT